MRRIAYVSLVALLGFVFCGAKRASTPQLIYSLSDDAKQQIQTALPGSRLMLMEVTAYCPCVKCCGRGAHGVTASGARITQNGGQFVAADTSVLPFGTKLVIPGYGSGPVEVLDRGGAIKGNRLDVFFPTHEQAKAFGRRWVEILVTPND